MERYNLIRAYLIYDYRLSGMLVLKKKPWLDKTKNDNYLYCIYHLCQYRDTCQCDTCDIDIRYKNHCKKVIRRKYEESSIHSNN